MAKQVHEEAETFNGGNKIWRVPLQPISYLGRSTLNSDFKHALYLDSMLSFLLFSRLSPSLQKEDFVRIIVSKIESLTPEHWDLSMYKGPYSPQELTKLFFG